MSGFDALRHYRMEIGALPALVMSQVYHMFRSTTLQSRSQGNGTLMDSCKGSISNGLYSLFTCFISIRIICTIRLCLDSSVITYLPALTFVTQSFITSFATVFL